MLLHRSISRRFQILVFLSLCFSVFSGFGSRRAIVALADDKSPNLDKKDPIQKDDSEEIQDLDADSSDFSEGFDQKVEKEQASHANEVEVAVPVSDDN